MIFFLQIFVILASTLIVTAEGFNLFEFLQSKFQQVRPKYQPNPKNRIQHYRRPAPRWPPPRPQLQYNYDTPQDNLIEATPGYTPSPPQPSAPPQPQTPQPPRYHSYSRRPHYEAHEPEQPADIPIIVGQFIGEPPVSFSQFYINHYVKSFLSNHFKN